MKMKLFAATMAAAALFAACNKETNFGGESSVPEGLPTYASITISVNQPNTRATRGASLNEEKTVQTVQVLIFDKSGVLETVSGDLSVDGSNKVTEKITTTTGQKTIFAVVNKGSLAFDNEIKVGMPLKNFKENLFTAAEDGAGNAHVKIAQSGNFLMLGSSNVALVQKDEGEFNSVTVNVSRAAAKSQLLYGSSVTTSSSFQPEGVAVAFSNACSQLAQLRYKMYTWQEAATPLYSDFGAAEDTDPAVTNWTDDNTNDGAHWIAAVTEFDGAESEFGHALYAPENINQAPQMNNTTCMIVRLKAAPSKWSSDEGSQAGDGTFYALVKYSTNQADLQNYTTLASYYGIYKTEDAANTALSAIEAEQQGYYKVLTFTNGYCYYRLNLRDINETDVAKRYSVLRNRFYRVTVSEINNIGWNDPAGLVTPGDSRPVEAQTSLEVTITVEDWIDVDMNESLG